MFAWCPDAHPCRKPESCGHDANDRVGLRIHPELRSGELGDTLEVLFPEDVAHYGYAGSVFVKLLSGKSPSA